MTRWREARFRTMDKSTRKDTHPESLALKVGLRRRLLAELPPGPHAVLDLFAGHGEMWAAVWRDAAAYAGCDSDPRLGPGHPADATAGRPLFVCDNRRLLRCLDLDAFDVFDLDAHGSPWEQATLLAARRRLRPGERVGLAWTDGASFRARLKSVERRMAALAGVRTDLPGASRRWDDLTAAALDEVARRMGGRVERRWLASRNFVYYGTAVLAEGRAPAGTAPPPPA